MKQITLTLPIPDEHRTFSIYKSDNIIIPESYPVVEVDSVLDFLVQCDEHLFEVKGAVYFMPDKNGSVIYCCSDFWNKYNVIIKEKEKELKKLQQEQAEQIE